MKQSNKLKMAVDVVKKWGIKNQPEILTGLGIAGVILTAYQAYKAGPVVDKILQDQKKEMKLVRNGDKKAKREVTIETAKKVGIALAPTTISGAATMGFILGSNRASNRRIAALSAAYTISETALKDLNKKLEYALGEGKVRKLKEEMSADKLKQKPVKNEGQIILTGDGDVLCMDLYTGRYFRSNATKIGQAINELSSRVFSDMYVSLNELYELLNLPAVPMGEDLGWNIDDVIRGSLPITFSAQLTDDHVPCLCIEYDATLRADFRKLL